MSFFGRLKEAILGRERAPSAHEQIELEDVLIEADFGVGLASKIAKEIGNKRDVIERLKSKLDSILTPLVADFEIDDSKKPFVIIMVGVNGGGKTTTVAKLARLFKSRGHSVSIAACDTFRVAAIEQLAVWADRLNCPIFKADTPRDPASVAYEAMHATGSGILLIDTAGRLQNNANLMSELAKIYKIVNKADASAPHMNIIVIDATTGQSAFEQAVEFGKVRPLSGIIVAKMDGNAKGGVVVRIADELRIPILGVGTGETEDSFEKFSVDKFLQDLVK
jgi:fused signal recognition particle receptor